MSNVSKIIDTAAKEAKNQVTADLVDSIDSLLSRLESLKLIDEKKHLDLLFKCAETYLKLTCETAERPIRFLRKYRDGSVKDEPISLTEMLNGDRGVSERIADQVFLFIGQARFFETTGMDISTSQRFKNSGQTGANAASAAYNSRNPNMDPAGFPLKYTPTRKNLPVFIDIKQEHFKVQDWRNAVGAIKLEWSILNSSHLGGANALHIKLWGKNTYQWHPTERRISQAFHKAATLIKKYGAKDFEMVFLPTVRVVLPVR